jgi:hypothetical protein
LDSGLAKPARPFHKTPADEENLVVGAGKYKKTSR